MPEKITLTLDEFWTVELGDLKSPDLEPQVKVSVWANECNFSLRLAHAGNMEQVGEFYKFTAESLNAEIDPNGIHLRLDSTPDTNQIVYTIRVKNLVFWKQENFIEQDGVKHYFDENGYLTMGDETYFRDPDGVLNSFAVYHAEGKEGGKYKKGKVFHMFTPKCIDANGVVAYCDWFIDIEAETLTVVLPQQFLNTAAYPVEIT